MYTFPRTPPPAPHQPKTNRQTFCNQSHAKKLLRNLHETRSIPSLCDGVIIVENQRFPIQKCVLAAISPYIRALHNFQTSEPITEHHLNSVRASAFSSILDFAYSGNIELCDENIQDVLQAADLLLISDLKDVCCTYLEGCINVANCLGIMEFAERFTCPRTRYKASEFLEKYFTEIAKSEEFFQLSEERLINVLSRNKLCVDSENDVLLALVRWVKHDSPNRMPKFRDIVETCINVDTALSLSVGLRSLLQSFSEEELSEFRGVYLRDEKSTSRNPDSVKKKQLPRGCTEVLVVTGGMNLKDALINECWMNELPPNNWTRKWIKLASMNETRRNHGLVSAAGYVYAIGGESENKRILSSGERYDAEANAWSPIAPMKQARYSFGLVAHGDKIYAIGGIGYRTGDVANGTCSLTTCEEYNIYSNTWRSLPDIQLNRQEAACCVADGKIYLIAGLTNGKIYESVEVFDPMSETWYIAPSLKERRFGAHAVGVGENIYVLGGYRPLECPSANHEGLKFCPTETYFPGTGAWCNCVSGHGMVASSHATSLEAALCSVQSPDCQIYIVGDLDVGDSYHFVRGYNLRTNSWHEVMRNHPPTRAKRFKAVNVVISRAALWSRVTERLAEEESD